MASAIVDNGKTMASASIQATTGLLEEKVAIITGSNRGIGRSTALIFAQHGAKVVIIGRDRDACNEVVEEIKEQGGDAFACPIDIMNETEVKNMIDQVVAQYGTIDILVNNAGTSRDALIHKMSDDNYRYIMDINLKGTHLCTKAVLEYFTQDERLNEFKKIVNIASITGITGNFGQSNYGMAKSGIVAYSKACARELARKRICVNVVAPGFTETRMTEVKQEGRELGMPKPIRNLAISSTPFARDGKAGQPEHMANVILFLASGLSDWLTGQVFTVDGGMYI